MNPSPASPGLAEIRAELPILTTIVRHPLPLFLAAGAAVWAGEHSGQSVPFTLSATLFAYILALLTVTDLKHGILPHILTGLLALLGTTLAPSFGLSYWGSTLGGLVAYGGLLLCALVTEKLTGKAALGGGDLWLTLGLGTWLGVSGLPMLLAATAVTGLFSILIKRWLTQGMPTYMLKHDAHPENAFPFGPALCAAGWLAFLYAPLYWQCIEMLTIPAN